jgi:hypothetical protein
MATKTASDLKVADEVWIATALLHREHPRLQDFSIAEIVDRARREGVTPRLRPGVYVHALQHCVANRPPNPGRYRMLFETGEGRRRLFCEGDPYHPAREGAKTCPQKEDIPSAYHRLIDWYKKEYTNRPGSAERQDPLLALWGSGKELWADEHSDDYIRRLREGWE